MGKGQFERVETLEFASKPLCSNMRKRPLIFDADDTYAIE
jgi:hypothetical protein